MRKVLTICPTIRPKMLEEMSDSFYNTSEENNKLVINDRTDITVTQIINSYITSHPNYDYYHITNDDVIYKTKGWDTKLIESIKGIYGISYGNDLFQGENLPTFPMISREICMSIGWLQYPGLIRYYGDTVWKTIGNALNCLYYNPDVIIEHKTWFNGKNIDKPNDEQYLKDTIVFFDWLKTKFPNNLETIKERIKSYDQSKLIC